ncbi:hypothetical protein AUC70_05475 [Methyloceanibacter stevinii]|uniref:Uncharacterized protein n=1 Tax=Methyloceanibacter stevinii TaxID=1774970 RepID=A0A1E3VNR3_9HYPH|nr:hypothetical protein [Methyloceanibacter stevinii]ODR95167.1 hypothetical protein AUC70_05475 [Methyloceanibacter stevinii]
MNEIENVRVREHYRREIKNRLFELWRPQPRRGKDGRPGRSNGAKSVRREALPPPTAYGFGTIVALALVNHPWLLDQYAEEIASVDVTDKKLAALLAAATRAIHDDHAITREALIAKLRDGSNGELLDRLFLESHHARHAFLKPDMPRDEVEEQFTDMLYRWRALPTLSREIAESAELSPTCPKQSTSASPFCSRKWRASASSRTRTMRPCATRSSVFRTCSRA